MAEQPIDMIHFESGVNPEGKPFVHISWRGEHGQLSPEEAREHARGIFEVAEAAEMDALVLRWLMDNVHVPLEKAAILIRDLRQLRGETG